MNIDIQKRWEDKRDTLLGELKENLIVEIIIPGWSPVDLKTGLLWMRGCIYEGYNVDFLITHSREKITVRMKKWEFGEDEPDFIY